MGAVRTKGCNGPDPGIVCVPVCVPVGGTRSASIESVSGVRHARGPVRILRLHGHPPFGRVALPRRAAEPQPETAVLHCIASRSGGQAQWMIAAIFALNSGRPLENYTAWRCRLRWAPGA